MPAPCAQRDAFNRLARGCGLTHPQAGRGRHAIYMVNRVSGEGNATPAYRCRRNNAYLIACPAPPQMRSTARPSSSLFDLSSRADPVPCGFASGHAPSRDQPVAIFFVARGQRRAVNLPRPSTACRLKQSLTSISTRQDNRDAIGGYWNVSSPPYSAPMSSATAASWGRTRRRRYALSRPTVS